LKGIKIVLRVNLNFDCNQNLLATCLPYDVCLFVCVS
jgi:hypothetical protein